MKSLKPPDNHCLHAAIGWLELGNHTEANEELEKISPGLRAHPDMLEVRLEIYAKAKKWAMFVDIAGAIIKLDPTRPDAWIQRSFALLGMKQPQMALDQLLPWRTNSPRCGRSHTTWPATVPKRDDWTNAKSGSRWR